GCRARKSVVRPDGPIANPLMRLQSSVCATDQFVHINGFIVQDQHGVHVIRSYDSAFADFWKRVEYFLDVFRINVQAFWRDNQVFFTASKVETSFGIDFAEIARMQPSAIRACDTLAAYEDLAVWSDHHFLTRQRPADRSGSSIERMVDCNHQTCLRQSISL